MPAIPSASHTSAYFRGYVGKVTLVMFMPPARPRRRPAGTAWHHGHSRTGRDRIRLSGAVPSHSAGSAGPLMRTRGNESFGGMSQIDSILPVARRRSSLFILFFFSALTHAPAHATPTPTPTHRLMHGRSHDMRVHAHARARTHAR